MHLYRSRRSAIHPNDNLQGILALLSQGATPSLCALDCGSRQKRKQRKHKLRDFFHAWGVHHAFVHLLIWCASFMLPTHVGLGALVARNIHGMPRTFRTSKVRGGPRVTLLRVGRGVSATGEKNDFGHMHLFMVQRADMCNSVRFFCGLDLR